MTEEKKKIYPIKRITEEMSEFFREECGDIFEYQPARVVYHIPSEMTINVPGSEGVTLENTQDQVEIKKGDRSVVLYREEFNNLMRVGDIWERERIHTQS